MFNKKDTQRNACQLYGDQANCGYDWWWHSFTAHHARTGEEQAFYIEYFLCNPKSGTDKPIFGQLPENKEKHIKPSYLMVNVGAWGKNKCQLHRFFGWDETKVGYSAPYTVEADDCYATETQLKGSVHITDAEKHPQWLSDNGAMSWNLKVDKKVAFNVGYGAGKLLRKWQLFEMFWHAEGMKTAYSGEVIWNGERYLVAPENCYGYADKNWGKDFTTPWLWLSSNNLTSVLTGETLANSVFDIGGGRPKIGFLSLKGKLLSAFWYEGVPYEFNFSKFWTFTRTKFRCYETDTEVIWHVEQRTWFHKMVTDVTCKKEEMLQINYEAPNGSKRHQRLWNGGTGIGTVELYHRGKLVDRISAKNIGCEYGEYDTVDAYKQ